MPRQVKAQAIPYNEANVALWIITAAIIVCTLMAI